MKVSTCTFLPEASACTVGLAWKDVWSFWGQDASSAFTLGTACSALIFPGENCSEQTIVFPGWCWLEIYIMCHIVVPLYWPFLNVSFCLLQVVPPLAELVFKTSAVSQRRWNKAAAFAQAALNFQLTLNLQLIMGCSIAFLNCCGMHFSLKEWAVEWTTSLCAFIRCFWSHERSYVITRLH